MELFYLDAEMRQIPEGEKKEKAYFVRQVGHDSLGNRVEFVQVYYEGIERDLIAESEELE